MHSPEQQMAYRMLERLGKRLLQAVDDEDTGGRIALSDAMRIVSAEADLPQRPCSCKDGADEPFCLKAEFGLRSFRYCVEEGPVGKTVTLF